MKFNPFKIFVFERINMKRKLIIAVFFFSFFSNLIGSIQLPLKFEYDKNSFFNFFIKVFVKLDSALHITKITPPADTASILIPVYPPIPEKEVTTDYQHRIGAYEAWQRGDYQGIIDSLSLVKNQIDVDFRLLANSYYRLDSLELALNSGEKIIDPDGETLYTLGLFAITLRKYTRAIRHFRNSIIKNATLKTSYARLGDVYYIVNDHKNALKYWIEAKEKGYNKAYINYFIGYIYFENKDLDRASEYFAYLDEFESEGDWFVRAKYFQALIQEQRGSRETALEILSEIEIYTIGMSQIEYDMLKKKIYSHFWLGIKKYNSDPQVAYEHFINAEALISSNSRKFVGQDRVIVDLLNGVLQRLGENLKKIKKHTISSQHFHSYTETWLNSDKRSEMSEYLMRISAEILYHCQEPVLSARFYNYVMKNPICEMNYYVLKPDDFKEIPDFINMPVDDTLKTYILFNYMAISYLKGDYIMAENLFNRLIKSLSVHTNIKNLPGLRFTSHFYRSRWLEHLFADRPEQILIESEKINKLLNEIKAKNADLNLPNYFYLPDGKLFLMALSRT